LFTFEKEKKKIKKKKKEKGKIPIAGPFLWWPMRGGCAGAPSSLPLGDSYSSRVSAL
jgi:hypothetical protein